MADHERDEDGVEALHRMIAYVRDEALRLRIMDVAILLGHAEAAAKGFASPERDREDRDAANPPGVPSVH